MSHAILLKPASSGTTLFSNAQTQSFGFKARYDPVVLLKSSSTVTGRIVFDWTVDEHSLLENHKGPLGISKPTSLYVTKQLHQFKGFPHAYELVVEHVNTQGNRKVFFVFFLQLKAGATKSYTELDRLLDSTDSKKSFDLQSFVQSAWKGQNVYYQTTSKDHVFVFPTVIPVSNKKIFEMTGTPTPAAQVYREIFLQDKLLDLSHKTAEKARERTVVPLSQDVVVLPFKKTAPSTVEGFGEISNNIKINSEGKNKMHRIQYTDSNNGSTSTDADLHCYPVDDDEQVYENYVFQHDGIMDGTYMTSFFMVFLVSIPICAVLAYNAVKPSEDYYIYGFAFIHLVFLIIGITLSSIAHVQRTKKEKHKSANTLLFVGLIFLILWFVMYGFSFLFLTTTVIGDDNKLKWVDFEKIPEAFSDVSYSILVYLSLIVTPLLNSKKEKSE
jgi:hypothetical protein